MLWNTGLIGEVIPVLQRGRVALSATLVAGRSGDCEDSTNAWTSLPVVGRRLQPLDQRISLNVSALAFRPYLPAPRLLKISPPLTGFHAPNFRPNALPGRMNPSTREAGTEARATGSCTCFGPRVVARAGHETRLSIGSHMHARSNVCANPALRLSAMGGRSALQQAA